ncbi:MAG: P-type conjugative transfer protein TrbL [Alphaproteobacteria bacterium]|nr:P-type conjugative transfer protein TrbL [Alphaproteobacteria bacterium]
MNNLGVIDQFLQTFIRYIDGGFGLLGGDVAHLTTILVGIDVTLAGLFWALDGGTDVVASLLKKVLYVGAFALILNNFETLSTAIYNSFAALGLAATNNTLGPQDLLLPGKLASIGFQAAWPLLKQAGSLVGFTTFIDHAVTIFVLVVAWLIVVLAFFILAVQLFITVLEFKLTTLAGFVLVPFALWNKTAFLAERVLGNVVAAGVKVMVLAVIVGIGDSFFSQYTNALQGQEPSLAQAMSLVLASLALFGLGIFGPGIATGLVSGAPQLGAGAVAGTVGAVAAGAALTGAAAWGGARLAGSGGLAAIRAGSAVSTAYGLGRASSQAEGLGGVGAGLAGVARAGAGMFAGRTAGPFADAVAAGRAAAWRATGGAADEPGIADEVPGWARRMQAAHRRHTHTNIAMQAVKDGDRPGSGLKIDLGE